MTKNQKKKVLGDFGETGVARFGRGSEPTRENSAR